MSQITETKQTIILAFHTNLLVYSKINIKILVVVYLSYGSSKDNFVQCFLVDRFLCSQNLYDYLLVNF